MHFLIFSRRSFEHKPSPYRKVKHGGNNKDRRPGNGQIRRALVFFAQQNQWDLSNYDSFDMKALGEDSYRDLSGIGIPTAKKCKALARDSLSLLAYVK